LFRDRVEPFISNLTIPASLPTELYHSEVSDNSRLKCQGWEFDISRKNVWRIWVFTNRILMIKLDQDIPFEMESLIDWLIVIVLFPFWLLFLNQGVSKFSD
jgi:hypothetical protein